MATQKKATRNGTGTKKSVTKTSSDQVETLPLSPRFWKVILTACAVTVLLELLMLFGALGGAHRHDHFESENGNSVLAAFSNWFGFYGLYGLMACVGSVLLAKGLSVFLKAKEDYYDGTP